MPGIEINATALGLSTLFRITGDRNQVGNSSAHGAMQWICRHLSGHPVHPSTVTR